MKNKLPIISKIITAVCCLLIVFSLLYLLKKDSKVDNKSESSIQNEDLINKEDLWQKLTGYWTFENSDFVYFGKDEKLLVNFGTWYSEIGRDPAFLTKYIVLDKYNFILTIKFPAQRETTISAAYPDLIMDITIDISDYENKNITIKSKHGEVTYHFSGYTIEQSLKTIEQDF